eukprot:4030691-Prymnesium_polylepis.1
MQVYVNAWSGKLEGNISGRAGHMCGRVTIFVVANLDHGHFKAKLVSHRAQSCSMCASIVSLVHQ